MRSEILYMARLFISISIGGLGILCLIIAFYPNDFDIDTSSPIRFLALLAGIASIVTHIKIITQKGFI